MKALENSKMVRAAPVEAPAMARATRWLGFAGLAPQFLMAVISIAGPESYRGAVERAALVYSGTILSFIGGAWWGLSSRAKTEVHWAVRIAAVTPSLIAFAAIEVWAIGMPTSQSLWVVGASLMATLGVDYKLAASGVSPPGWIRLRVPLSLGLGSLTILIAIFA